MKQIIYFLLLLLITTGCSQYEYNKPDPGLKIKESQLRFSSKGGDGYIIVESDGSISAKSNADWCKIQVDGKKINVTVAPYTALENRTAIVSVTSDAGIPVDVPVTQSASQFIIGNLSFDIDCVAATLKTLVIHDEEVIVSSEDTWIDAKYKNDSIFISVLMNNSSIARSGKIVVKSGVISQTVFINQVARSLLFDDLLGDWEMSYNKSSSTSSTLYKKDIVFKKSTAANVYDVTGFDLNATMKIKFNSTSKTLEIYGSQDMGVDPNDSNHRIIKT